MTTKADTKSDDPKVVNKSFNKKPRAGLKDFRIIVRNLPFTTTSDELKAFFEKYGAIKDVQLPKCKDPRYPKSCAGFAFIQYGARNSARQAIDNLNFSEFKGRKIAVDWTINKDEYVSQNLGDNEKQRMLAAAAKFIKPSKNEVKDEIKEEEMEVEEQHSDYSELSDDDISGSENEEDEDMELEKDIKMEKDSDDEISSKPSKKPERKPDTAVEEGRVIFLRNVSFDTSNESLKEHLSRFGDVALTIMCKFAGTDQPTGNAFVHFKDKESADKCLEELEVSGLFIDERIVEGYRAVPREEASKFEKKTKQGKDNRNLKLLRVSLVRPGTAQARGMSEEDAQLRQRLVEAAKVKLKHLHMFVSTKRLAIHNVPFSYHDNDLYELCMRNATKKAKIIDCRIMRNKKGKDDKGHAILGKSKGFGFVEFAEHLDALTCLRNLNNNSEIFSDKKRPIVEFSIENLKALKIQQKRREPQDQSNDKKKTSFEDKNTRSEQMAVQRTKRQISRDGMKALPKKFGVKIRHKNMKKGGVKKTNFNDKRADKLKGRKMNIKKKSKK